MCLGARHVQNDDGPGLDRFAEVLTNAKRMECLAYGVCTRAECGAVVSMAKAKVGDITRTKDNWKYTAGAPAILMLDYDAPANAPAVDMNAWLGRLYEACPALESTERLWRPSTSSLIYLNGIELRGLCGQRLYLAVADGSDIPRAGKVLFERLWLARYGHVEISRAGSLLLRAPVDAAVFSPERLDFVASAICKDGLNQTELTPQYLDGAPLLDTRAAIPDLCEAEQDEYERLVAEAKEIVRPQAETVREAYVEARAGEIAQTRGCDLESARATVRAALTERGELGPDFLLHFDKYGPIAVADVLAHRATLSDPVELEYHGGRNIAVMYTDRRFVRIYSQAHGGRNYVLIAGDAGGEAPPPLDAYADEPELSSDERTSDTHPRGYKLAAGGVYFQEEQGESTWLCSRLDVTAYVRNDANEAWGRLLEFKDPECRPHAWAMPNKMLAGDGSEYRRVLLDMGLEMATGQKARNLLAAYIQQTKPVQWARCVTRTGWHNSGFVLPDEVIGNGCEERLLLQTTGGGANPYRAAGTPEEWKHEVAALCVGNTRLVFSVSTAFASTLLEITRDESGGIHWRGPSSSGKTTIIEVACSVWGSPAPEAYLHRWRATINGLEAVAVLHNDTLLALDEVTQVDPREAGEAAYMLANGTGKHRANRYGGSRDTQTWRTLFLSSGELSLADHMQAAGKRALAGQETRLVDIAADTGIHGVFEDLHGYANGATFSHALRRVAHKYYGTAGREFLRKLVSSMESIAGQIAELRQDFIAEHVPENASGQVERVAQRFALIAAGGELATALGITGWPEGEAIKSAVACFRGWLNTRGGASNQEEEKALSQVCLFFQLHGESRFTPWVCPKCNGSGTVYLANGEQGECLSCGGTGYPTTPTRDRAGWRKVTPEGEIEFYALPQVFKTEICKGLDWRFVARLLVKRGLVYPDKSGKSTVSRTPPGYTAGIRVYHFRASVVGE